MKLNKYNVTFTIKDKYHPTTRTNEVDCKNEFEAQYLIASNFNGLKIDKKTKLRLIDDNKISIDKVEKIKVKPQEELKTEVKELKNTAEVAREIMR